MYPSPAGVDGVYASPGVMGWSWGVALPGVAPPYALYVSGVLEAYDSCGVYLHGMGWYDMVWFGMVWFDMVWYGMVCYGMVRYSKEGKESKATLLHIY